MPLCAFDRLPNPLLRRVLSYCLFDSLHKQRLELVCRRWRWAVQHSECWRRNHKELRLDCINTRDEYRIHVRIGQSLHEINTEQICEEFSKLLSALRPLSVHIRSYTWVTERVIKSLLEKKSHLTLHELSVSHLVATQNPFWPEMPHKDIPKLIEAFSASLRTVRLWLGSSPALIKALGQCTQLQRLYFLPGNRLHCALEKPKAEELLLAALDSKPIRTLRVGVQPPLSLVALDRICRSLPLLRNLSVCVSPFGMRNTVLNLHRAMRRKLNSLSLDLATLDDAQWLYKIPSKFPSLTRLHVVRYTPDYKCFVAEKYVYDLLEAALREFGAQHKRLLLSVWAREDCGASIRILLNAKADRLELTNDRLVIYKNKLSMILDPIAVLTEFCH